MGKTVTRLYETFQPSHYELALQPDGEAMTFTGSVTIKGKKVGRPTKRITLHGKGLKATSATITKHDKKGEQTFEVTRINLQQSFDEIRLHTEQSLFAGEYTLSLEFSGKIHEVMHGIYPCNYVENGVDKKLIATQFESHHAREAFPCVDEPEAKATFDLTLTTPTGQSVVANTPVKKQHEADNSLVTTFETTPKMSTYLLAFVYGDLQCKEAKTKDGVDVRVWATKAQSAAAMDFPLDVAVKTVEFFNDYYGVPYPLPKCDHVALPDFSAAAMENWGLITYREGYLLVDPETTNQSMKEIIVTVIAHEMSHQWFGNLVTMKWWDDLWLNESFANVMEYVAASALFPEWNLWETFVSREGLSSQRRDSLPGVQSVHTAVNHPDEIGTLFDPSIVYAKGGRLLNMLMHYVGEDDFRKGLKLYFEKHAYGNTVGDDLWNAITTASGKDVAGFMTPWLSRSGFPLVTVDQQATKLHINQQHFLVDPSKTDDRVWPVALLSTDDGVPTLFSDANLEVTLPVPYYIRVNNGAFGHYIVRYAQTAHAEAVAKLAENKTLTPAERLMLLSDSSMISRAGLASFGETLQLLGHYTHEGTETVWDMISLILADARRFIDLDESIEDTIKAFVRDIIEEQYERLGWNEHVGEPAEDTKLRSTIIGLGVYAEHPEILAKALEVYEAYKKNTNAVSSELRSIVFGAAVRQAVDGAFDYLLNLEETTQNPDLKNELMGALSLSKSPAHCELLLGRIKDSKKVRQQDVDSWILLLMRNRFVRRLAWDWMRDNWDWIERTFDGDKSYDSFPRYSASVFNTKDYMEEYRVFFEPKQSDVALTRNIALGIEELEARIAWLERDLDAVRTYFK